MRVLFDHQVFSWQTYGGISRYIFEIAKGMTGMGHESIFPEDFYSENVYLQGIPGVHAKPIVPFNFKGKKWLQERLGRSHSLKALREAKPDVFHPTYFGDYFLKTTQANKTPFVVTIHDMIHEKYGHGRQGMFSLDANVIEKKRLLAQQADAVIVVSDNTRRDVLQYIPGVEPEKIHTIYHGNAMSAPGPNHENRLQLPERFLLFVGQRRAYKNFSWMIDQLADLLRGDTTLYLVCAGGPPLDDLETAQLKNLGLTGKVLHPSIRSDGDLSELYSRAQCFIFPSTYEGFGFPVLEAFACGCPAILNGVSSLPEVGGDAALYFHENEEKALEKLVYAILNDQTLRRNLVDKGLLRASQFTWQKSVSAHLDVYQKLIEKI